MTHYRHTLMIADPLSGQPAARPEATGACTRQGHSGSPQTGYNPPRREFVNLVATDHWPANPILANLALG